MSTELVPFSEVQQLANAVARSRLFKAFDNPETALVLMMVAQAEGCHPIQATQRYDVIQGKPAKKADAMLADFQQRGGKITWKHLDDIAAEAEFMCPGLGAPVSIRWTFEMAKKAGLTTKGTWQQYPRAMLRSRVVSEGVRSAMPGVVAGLYTPEEVQDFAVDPAQPSRKEETRRVTIDTTAVDVVHPSDDHEIQIQGNHVDTEDPKMKAAKVRALVLSIKAGGVPESDRKGWMSNVLAKHVESSKDLSIAELDTLIEAAANLKGEA